MATPPHPDPSGLTSPGAEPLNEATPQLARARKATEQAWQRMEAEFGLLTSVEVAKALGADPSNNDYALSKRADNEIVGVLRDGEYRYPGFQFDRERGMVLHVIAPLIQLARDNGWSDESLVLWLQGPNTSFEHESRPVDHLGSDPDAVMAAAQNAFEVEW